MKFSINRSMMAAVIALSSNPVALAGSPQTDAAGSGDASVIQGFNTSGTVRVCNLANLEAVLNLLANVIEVTGILIGCFLLVRAITRVQEPHRERTLRGLTGMLAMVIGVLTPQAINWCVATARDANLFS